VIFMGMSSLPGPAGVVNSATDRPMHALRAHRRGGSEQLVYEQAPRPPLAIGDALVRVHAASFTPTELGWPSTWTDRLGRDRTPVIPGHEVSGVVATLGFGTSGLTMGEEVYGLTDWYHDGPVARWSPRSAAPRSARRVRMPAGCSSWSRPTGPSWPSWAAGSTPASCGRSSAGCCRWPKAARRSRPKQHGGLPGKVVLRVADQR
jgi:hypothetical protein